MKEKIISPNLVNLLLMIFIPVIMGVILLLFFIIRVDNIRETTKSVNLIFFVGGLILGFFLHELIHGIFFAKFVKGGFKSVKFGFFWKTLAPYCHCKEAISIKNYRIAALMPTVILGFIPVIVGFVLNNFTILFLGSIMIVGGIGDFIIVWMCRDLDKNSMIMDHPDKLGFYYQDSEKQ
jgi:hypothetical protein